MPPGVLAQPTDPSQWKGMDSDWTSVMISSLKEFTYSKTLFLEQNKYSVYPTQAQLRDALKTVPEVMRSADL